jgi:hypothetical protein
LPERKQRVQTEIRIVCPLLRAWTDRRFGRQRRLVTLCAWEMRFPTIDVLPQILHARAIHPPPPREGTRILARMPAFAKRDAASPAEKLVDV